MIERDFDIPMIANLAFREKQIQQKYRPLIAVHKWFARRPGTLFRGLLLAELGSGPLRDTFFRANNLSGSVVADPFMGGGTPLMEANRLGCDVFGTDINPMAYWIVKQELGQIDLEAYSTTANSLRMRLDAEIGGAYRTRCENCGAVDAQVKYFLWVKVVDCPHCSQDVDLFPGYLLATDSRHPKNVIICPGCGKLVEREDRIRLGKCDHCGTILGIDGPAKRGRCICSHCGGQVLFPGSVLGPPRHRMFAIEYYCQRCKHRHSGRYFKAPDERDIARFDEVRESLVAAEPRFVPDDEIPSGDETDRLHRWGYSRYREMFNERQLLGLEASARRISELCDPAVRGALATNFSDLLRYQNMLCRYDANALKSLDIFSIHGFPVGLIQCESNILGIVDSTTHECVGSGGWANMIEKYRKAKSFCGRPYEMIHDGRQSRAVWIDGEWIGERRVRGGRMETRAVNVRCADATEIELAPGTLDIVLTDPPYLGNVQYAELMDFCFVWLKGLIGEREPAFQVPSTRNKNELTANADMARGITHFTDGLSTVFSRMARALKAGRPFAFTYHHNDITAYYPIAVAVLDSGLTCTASLPCPAEMGASIHINNTQSSIIDTVFVCRSTGAVPRKWLATTPFEVAQLVNLDVAALRQAGIEPSSGDKRCIAFGHMTRLAIWVLRIGWDANQPTSRRIARVAEWIQSLGGWPVLEPLVEGSGFRMDDLPLFAVRESTGQYQGEPDEISF